MPWKILNKKKMSVNKLQCSLRIKGLSQPLQDIKFLWLKCSFRRSLVRAKLTTWSASITVPHCVKRNCCITYALQTVHQCKKTHIRHNASIVYWYINSSPHNFIFYLNYVDTLTDNIFVWISCNHSSRLNVNFSKMTSIDVSMQFLWKKRNVTLLKPVFGSVMSLI